VRAKISVKRKEEEKMMKEEEEDAMEIALREEKARQESSFSASSSSPSTIFARLAENGKKKSANAGRDEDDFDEDDDDDDDEEEEDELAVALRPFQNHASAASASDISTREEDGHHRNRPRQSFDVDVVSSKRHGQMQEILANDGSERGTCVAMGPLGAIAVGFSDGTVRLTRAQHAGGDGKDEKKDSAAAMRTIPAIQREEGDGKVSSSRDGSSFLKVTALSFANGGEWLVSGHDDASIALWDVKRCTQLKRVKASSTTTPASDASMVVAIVAMNEIPNSGSQCEVIVALKSGQVLRHEFSWFGPLLRNKTTSLGEKTFVIGGDALPSRSYAVKPPVPGTVPWFWGDEKLKEQLEEEADMNNSALLDSTIAMDAGIGSGTTESMTGVSNLLPEFSGKTNTSAANAAGLVCLTTASACLVMRLYPDAEVVAKIPRPKDVDASKVPYARFRPKVVSYKNLNSNASANSSNTRSSSNEGDMETRELAVVWGNCVTIWELGILSPENVLKVNREIQKQKMEKKEGPTAATTKSPKGQSGGRCVPKLRKEWQLPENVAKDSDGCGLMWFGDDVLGVICGQRVATLLAFDVKYSNGKLLERVALDAHPTAIPLTIPSRDAPKQPSSSSGYVWSSHGSCANRGAGAVILSTTSIRVCKILGWRERVNSHRKRSDWGGAFALAVAAYKQSFIRDENAYKDTKTEAKKLLTPFAPYLSGMPSDARARIMNESQLPQTVIKSEREAAREVCLKLLPQFLKDAMMVVQATSGEDDQAHVHAESVARATLAVCLAVDSLDKMYDQSIYDPLMEATHGKEAFIERIVPHVINDELQSLPPEVMQSLVTHFASKGEHGIIEKCVLRMDVTSLDVNQVARLCETHGMFAAHASVFVRAFEDFSSPAFAMFEVAVKMVKAVVMKNEDEDENKKRGIPHDQNEDARFELSRKSARRLLLFARESIAGRLFPPRFSEDMKVRKQNELDDPVHVARRAEKARFDLMRFLLSPDVDKSVRETAVELAKGKDNEEQASNANAFRQFWRGVDSLRKKRFKNSTAQAVSPVDALLTSSQIKESFDTPDAPDRLLFLFSVEPAATTAFLKDALDSWDASERELFEESANDMNRTTDRMAAQVVCDAALFAAESIEEETTFAAEETLNARLLGIKNSLLTFAAALVGTGRVSVDHDREFALLEALTAGPAKTLRERSDAACLIVAQTVDDLTRRHGGANNTSAAVAKYAQSKVFTLLSDANFAQGLTVLHLAEGDYGAALETLAAKDVLIRPNSAGYFADVLLGCAPAGIEAANENDAGPAVGRARALPAGEAREAFKRSLLLSAPKIAEVNAGIIARLGVAHFADQQEAVLHALSSNPLFQFWYLREVLAGKSAMGEDDLAEATARGEKDDHQTLARLIERSGVKVTEEMSELYVKLMCQFEPSNVLPFLKSRSGGYRLDACLEQCQTYGVVDASAHILEKMGRVGDALNLHVQKYEQNVEALSNVHNNNPTTSSATNKMSKDVSRGFAMESSESLDAATQLCLRCDTYKFIESEEMWHRLLDCVISARIRHGSSGQFVDQTLREHVERILHDTLERVAPEKVLSDVLKTRGNESLRELRRVLTGILETVEREKDGVRKEEKGSEHKVLKAMAEKLCALKRGRRANDVKLVVTQRIKHSTPSPLSSSSSRQKQSRRNSLTTKTAMTTTTPTRPQLEPKTPSSLNSARRKSRIKV
jgi:hypothetical protein